MKKNKKDSSVFIKLLGNYPLIRILNHLLIFRELDYSLTDIAKNSDVAWSTLNLLWPDIEKKQIVIHTRNVGKAKMFKLNIQNTIVQDLVKFADAIVWDYTHTSILKEKTKKKIPVYAMTK